MVSVSFNPYIPENYNPLYSAPESNTQNLRDRDLDSSYFFRYKHITSLKNTLRLQKATVCPTGFRATFATVFVLIYWLREFSLSAVTNP